MHDDDPAEALAAIRQVIEAQFASLRWDHGSEADWNAFESGFVPGARMHPAARPLRTIDVPQFRQRMTRLQQEGVLATFSERGLGCRIQVFGNVAVALAACEMTENASTATRDVSGFLLVRDDGVWRICAQAWDGAPADAAVPALLAALAPQAPAP